MATHVSSPPDFAVGHDEHLEFVNGRFEERVLGGKIHSDCQFNVVLQLKPIAKRMGASVHQEWSLAHGEEWLVPDVMLTRPGPYETDQRGYLLSTPLLCIEILSPGQTQSELLEKCRRYHAWGVPHCWVIDPAARVGFESDALNTFQLIGANEDLTAGDVRLSVADIFGGMSAD